MTWLRTLIEFLLRTLAPERRIDVSIDTICRAFLTQLHDAHGRIRRDLDPALLWEMERTTAHLHPILDTLTLLADLKANGRLLRAMPTPSTAARPRPGAPDPVFIVRRIHDLLNRIKRLAVSAAHPSSPARREGWTGPKVRDGAGPIRARIVSPAVRAFRAWATKARAPP